MTPQTPVPHLAQLALCTHDIPRLKRFLVSVFGFLDARGENASGQRMAVIQGEQPDDFSYFLWWLVGRNQLMQFELFQYVDPSQRPLPIDWRPSDIGWNRYGILVTDFDACLARAIDHGARPFTAPIEIGGRRRFAFRDPYIGLVIEVIEDDAPGSDDPHDRLPAFANIVASVADLDAARKFWLDDLGLPEDTDYVVDPAREQLWGLGGIELSGFSVQLNGIAIEIVAYHPAGRSLGRRRLCDHGVTNVGLLFRDREPLHGLIERLQQHGHDVPMPSRPGPIASLYMYGPDEIGVELFCVPEFLDERVGFVPRADARLN